MVAAGSRPGLITLLSRVTQLIKPLLDAQPTQVQQQEQRQQHGQQQQGQQQQQPPWPPWAYDTPMQQQQQQQQNLRPPWPPAPVCSAATGNMTEPLAKKPRLDSHTAAAAAGCTTAIHTDSRHVILDMLLSAYAAASAGAPAADAAGDWRVEYLGLLQELPGLHGLLLSRLVGSLQGSAWAAGESPQQVSCRGLWV